MSSWEGLDEETDSMEVEEAVNEVDYDAMLEGKSLEDLCELRSALTGEDISSFKDLTETEEHIREEDIEWVSDKSELLEKPDYSFHWDGSPTHNVDWDEDTEPTERVLVKQRKR